MTKSVSNITWVNPELLTELPDGLRESGAIAVREKFGTISAGDVLDVGTSNGDFIKVLMKVLRNYNSFTGIDISEKYFKEGREHFRGVPVDFIEMDAEEMTFQENQFDTVCISYSLHHLENIDKVLAEMYRVLKPSGYLIIQEMYSDGEQTVAQQVDILVHHLDAKVDKLLGIPHFETLTRQRLRNYVNGLGLKEVDVFESSWSVKCLFCDHAKDCADPLHPSNIDLVLKEIDDNLTRVREHSSYDEIREKAESLKERVKAEGSIGASVMYFFGRK